MRDGIVTQVIEDFLGRLESQSELEDVVVKRIKALAEANLLSTQSAVEAALKREPTPGDQGKESTDKSR